MVEETASAGATDDLHHGFTIGDIRVDPRAMVLSGEDGTSASISESAMRLLVFLAENQHRSVAFAELKSTLGSGHPATHTEETVRELSDALAVDLGRPGFLHIDDDALKLTQIVELAGKGHFAGLIALWHEIKKRRVFRVMTAYALIAFIVLQVADAMIDTLPIPDGFFPIMLAVMAVGFPIVILLGWFFESTPQGIFLDRRATAVFMSRTAAVTGIVFLAGIAIGFAFALFNLTDFEKSTAETEDIAIAVLPFENFSGNPEDQDIADGIVEELLIELSRLKELRVVGRKASFYYRDREEDWQTIVANLGANRIVEGSIRRDSDNMRVAAQLIDHSGFHIWGENFDEPIDNALDSLAVQRKIARDVAGALPIQLSQESRRILDRTPTNDEQAYQLYLQGRKYLRDADEMGEYQSAETLFRDALESDPAFVDALAGLCETQLLVYQRSVRPSDYARATASCSRLITQDSLNAAGYVALGTLNRLSGNFAEAQTMFERALEASPGHEPALHGIARAVEGLGRYVEAEQYYLQSEIADPGYWQVYIGYGRYLMRGGRSSEAIEKYEQAIRLAPDNLVAYNNLGNAYFDNDQWEEAADAWQKSVDIGPTAIGHMNVGTAEYYLGNYANAEEHFRSGIDLAPQFYPVWGKLGAVLSQLNQVEDSQFAYQNAADYAQAAVEVNASDSRAMYYLASYFAHLGRHDEAQDWAEEAQEISPGDPDVHYFAAVVASLAGEDDVAVNSLAEALRLGYSVKIVRQDRYFQPYLASAELAEWIPGEQ